MEEAFEGLEGVAIIIDDILVYGANQEEHDERLQVVMERALEKGVKFNKDKYSFSASCMVQRCSAKWMLGQGTLVLSSTASEMTTFSTIYGRYRFLRMPFGLLSAP